MKMCLTTIILCTAIILIAFGIHTSNIIIVSIGGALVGVYNTMIYEQD